MTKKLNQFKDEIVQPDFSNLNLAESPMIPEASRSQRLESQSLLQDDPNVGLDTVTVGPLRDPPIVESPREPGLDADSQNIAKRRSPLDREPVEVVAVWPDRNVIVQGQSSSGLTTKSTLTRVQQRNHRLSIVAKNYLTHITQAGDTLHAISNKYYGKPDYYLDIYFANRDQLQNPSDIPEGLQLRIPEYSN
jgi:nucleoid-associated protein YgaU